MNEYPNSIRNNMVNTEYKINITSLPDEKLNYEVQREDSHKVRNLVISAVLVVSLFGGIGAITAIQEHNLQKNATVVSTEVLPGGATLNITENPVFSFIVTPNGDKVGNYDGISAQELAKNYYESGPALGK